MKILLLFFSFLSLTACAMSTMQDDIRSAMEGRPQKNELIESVRGCCDGHGGVTVSRNAYVCNSSGKYVCNDDSESLSCSCK